MDDTTLSSAGSGRSGRFAAWLVLILLFGAGIAAACLDPFAPEPVRTAWKHASLEERRLGILDSSFPAWGSVFGVRIPVGDRRIKLLKECRFGDQPIKHLKLGGPEQQDIHVFLRNDNDPVWARLSRTGEHRGARWFYLQPHGDLQLLVLVRGDLPAGSALHMVGEVLQLDLGA